MASRESMRSREYSLGNANTGWLPLIQKYEIQNAPVFKNLLSTILKPQVENPNHFIST